MRSMFDNAVAFNQPIGTWDVSQAHGATQALSGLSPCVRLSVLTSWNVPDVNSAWRGARCGTCPCPAAEACVSGACAPVNDGFVHVGPIAWEGGHVPMAVMGFHGFRDCAQACRMHVGCMGFMLSSNNSCALRFKPIPDEQPIMKTGENLVFLKHTCATYSCPQGERQVASQDISVSGAQCCACAAPGFFKDLAAAPALQCLPCPAGTTPALSGSECEACPLGHYAYAQQGSPHCIPCQPGSKPSRDGGTCEPCPAGTFSPGGVAACEDCHFPRLLVDDVCVWWHIPPLAVGIAAIMVAGSVLFRMFARKRLRKQQAEIQVAYSKLYAGLWDEISGIGIDTSELQKLGVDPAEVATELAVMRARQSSCAGVSMGYLLSEEFRLLAETRTALVDPTFEQMKSGFWFGPDPIGGDVQCPRDGQMGCALVDWLPRIDRREQTHFMSWVWRYHLSQVTSALQVWRSQSTSPVLPQEIFFFMCFFVNNQFRIFVDGTQCASNDLGQVFRTNLLRCGKMVAILDTWEEPLYLTRVWTVFEQFVASTMQVPTTFLMPETATISLHHEIKKGEAGIGRITEAVSWVSSEKSKATKEEDEMLVKQEIEKSVGFAHVDSHVREVMVRWIGTVVQSQFQKLIDGKCHGGSSMSTTKTKL